MIHDLVVINGIRALINEIPQNSLTFRHLKTQ